MVNGLTEVKSVIKIGYLNHKVQLYNYSNANLRVNVITL